MAETWAVEQRLLWIKEMIEIYGYINREHIVKKFWVSVPQASQDLGKAVERWPDLITYDKSEKCYVASR